MNEIILKSLSAAEIKTLQNPNQEQVKQALPLILKEMALLGWVTVRKNTPKISDNLQAVVILGLFSVLLYVIQPVMFMIFAIIVFVIMVNVFSPKIEFQMTTNGHKALQSSLQPTMLVALLRELQTAIGNKGHCTLQDLKKQLRKKYRDNNGFHQDLLLHSLISKSLLVKQPDGSHIPTGLGQDVLAQVSVKIKEAQQLPALIRTRSPQALAWAAALGGIVLLTPDMEGYFAPLLELGLYEMDLEDESEKHAYSSDGGTTYVDDNDQEKHSDADWGDNSDFLDGLFSSHDGSLSSDSTGGCGSGCGIDGSGCGSSGCGSGCGGGCGGGCGS
jgi:hypothetical protein